jgi:molecular chaperone DnaK
VYQTEKTLKEHGDKVAEPERKAIEEALQRLKDVQKGTDKAAIDKAMEDLTQASHKLAEEMYKQAQSAQAQASDTGGGAEPRPAGSSTADEQAVEADYEVVDDEKKDA